VLHSAQKLFFDHRLVLLLLFRKFPFLDLFERIDLAVAVFGDQEDIAISTLTKSMLNSEVLDSQGSPLFCWTDRLLSGLFHQIKTN